MNNSVDINSICETPCCVGDRRWSTRLLPISFYWAEIQLTFWPEKQKVNLITRVEMKIKMEKEVEEKSLMTSFYEYKLKLRNFLL